MRSISRLKIITSTLFLLLLLLQVQAQDSRNVFVFTFAPGGSEFLLGYGNNRAELQRLKDEAGARRSQIYGDTLAVFVKSYCAADFHLAVIRSNHIKSVLITNADMREEFFITGNFRSAVDGKTDFTRVEVRVPLPEERRTENIARRKKNGLPVYQSDPTRSDGAKVGTRAGSSPVSALPQRKTRQSGVNTHVKTGRTPHYFSIPYPLVPPFRPVPPSLFIRTNLTYWLAALPNIGIEYKPVKSFGMLLNGGWNHFSWGDGYGQIRALFVQPEVRRYFGGGRRWFIGLEGHAGQFNFKLSKDGDGTQGDFYGGGLTGGYRLRLSRAFDMDFSLGMGYTGLKYEKYYRSNGVFVLKEGNLKKDFFGPSQVGVNLIWTLK